MSATVGKVYVDAVITDERYKECMALVQEANERIDELRELCRFVLMFTTMTDGCGDTCPYSCNNCQNECYFRKRARELGVEVDG